MRARAIAHPNLALVKYWGKSDVSANLPAVGSLSLTLEGMSTTTSVRFDEGLSGDVVVLDGVESPDTAKRVSRCLDVLRERAGVSAHVVVESENDFPTAAGLASSASGFAALAVAASAALGLELGPDELEPVARLGSGSAPRSLFEGICLMQLAGQGTRCRTVSGVSRWPLEVVVAIVETGPKKISSRAAMESTRETSPFYRAWVESHPADLNRALDAVDRKDFTELASVGEASCLRMHATAMAAMPGITYWRPATLACMETISALRADGLPVFFSIDAGPQVKAVCTPDATAAVVEALREVPGVTAIRHCVLGAGARSIGEGE